MIRQGILQEIVDFGLNKNDFAIFDAGNYNCHFHLIREFSKYYVYHIEERGGKSYIKEFSELNDAKEYLIDLYKILNGNTPFFSRVNNENKFNESKKKVTNLIEKELISNKNDTVLITLNELILKLKFKDLNNVKAEIKDLLISKSFSLKRNVFEEAFFFMHSLE